METYACFEDIRYEIIRLLWSAKSSVYICVAWINDDIYGPVLRSLASRNVQVHVIYNADEKNFEHGVMASPGVIVNPISARIGSALMHNKFCIIDNEILINGSYNWSKNAPLSFENIVVIKKDFQLIKYFLHEFYDLLNFYKSRATHSVGKCNICHSNTFNLGILGSENGKYSESQIDVWNVCARNQHAVHLGTDYQQFLASQLGLDDESYWETIDDSKESMLDDFNNERRKIQHVQQYFTQNFQNRIHAVGSVVMDNFNEHIKYGESPDYVVSIGWRDMYYRKIIPSTLHESDGDVHQIIYEHI